MSKVQTANNSLPFSSPKLTTKSVYNKHKQILGLLSIGTFLEYFDLMLYIHMMLFLNEIFLPATNSYNAKWLNAFTFCSTYVLRPFGVMILGLIGDRVGRKSTIVIATFMMALSCIVMANLPTYAQIGITASIIVTICRAIQGMSSIGEFIGSQLYINEVLKPPMRYVGVMLMPIASVVGTSAALYMTSNIIGNNLNWRYLFWFGGGLAIIGFFARSKLSETTEFIQAKAQSNLKINNTINSNNNDHVGINTKNKNDTNKAISSESNNQSVSFKTVLAIFLLNSSWPISSYFCYIYTGSILKKEFMFTSAQVVQGNFIISLANLGVILTVTYYVYKVNPLKLAKFLLIPFVIFSLVASFLLSSLYSANNLFITRLLILSFSPYSELVAAISFAHVPVLKRLT